MKILVGQLAGSRANKKGETSKTLTIKIARIPDSTVPFYLLYVEPTFYRCNFSYLLDVLFIGLSLPNDPIPNTHTIMPTYTIPKEVSG